MFVVLCVVVVVVVPPPCLASWSFLGVKYAALFFKSIFVAEKLSERSSPRGRYVYVKGLNACRYNTRGTTRGRVTKILRKDEERKDKK